MTYAQIIDGLPIGDIAYDSREQPYGAHPIDDAHEELCPNMLDNSQARRREHFQEAVWSSSCG
jgi:hypothetical protein